MNSPVENHMTRGVAWALATRWVLRFIGLVSTIILARLLAPEDFGIIAMCGIVSNLIANFSDLGIQQLFIREPDSSKSTCNAAWTMGIAQSVFLASVLVLSTPMAIKYFDEPRLGVVFYLLALTAIIDGMTNVGVVLARKQLDFKIEFRVTAVRRIAQFIATVTLAFVLVDYRALVYGNVIAAFVGTLYSYIAHPYRPWFTVGHAARYFRFGASIIPQRVGNSLYKSLDSFVIGGVGSTTLMGFYNLAASLPNMATFEVVLPVARGLYPSYATLKDEPQALVHAFLQGLAVTMAIIIPIGGGLWALSYEFVYVVYGSKWTDAVWFLEWLTIYSIFECVSHFMTQQILIVSGHEKRAALFMWAKLALFVPLLYIGFSHSGVEGITISRPIAAGLAMILSIVVLINSIPVTAMQVLAPIWRPTVSTGMMVIILIYFGGVLPFESGMLRLVSLSFLGMLSYIVGLALLWILAGKPSGLENYVVKFVKRRLA